MSSIRGQHVGRADVYVNAVGLKRLVELVHGLPCRGSSPPALPAPWWSGFPSCPFSSSSFRRSSLVLAAPRVGLPSSSRPFSGLGSSSSCWSLISLIAACSSSLSAMLSSSSSLNFISFDIVYPSYPFLFFSACRRLCSASGAVSPRSRAPRCAARSRFYPLRIIAESPPGV